MQREVALSASPFGCYAPGCGECTPVGDSTTRWPVDARSDDATIVSGRESEQGEIVYRDDRRPDTATIIALYRAAALSRPLDDPARIARMYDAANLILTAWDGDRLAGILRAWNDGGFLAYIADLAVDPAYQGRGIGRELLRRAVESDPEIIFLLHAAPTAMEFYRHVGWRAMQNAWVWPRERGVMSNE